VGDYEEFLPQPGADPEEDSRFTGIPEEDVFDLFKIDP